MCQRPSRPLSAHHLILYRDDDAMHVRRRRVWGECVGERCSGRQLRSGESDVARWELREVREERPPQPKSPRLAADAEERDRAAVEDREEGGVWVVPVARGWWGSPPGEVAGSSAQASHPKILRITRMTIPASQREYRLIERDDVKASGSVSVEK